MTGCGNGPKEYPKIGVRLDAGETAVGPILEGTHSKKTYSELIEAYLGRTGWMRVTVGSLLDSGCDRGDFFIALAQLVFNEQKAYLLLYTVLTAET
jgi:hypothetical protein